MKTKGTVALKCTILIASISIIVFLWGFLIPWEWSYVDEPGFVLANQETLRTHGVLGLFQAAISTTQSLADVGRVRPAYSVFVHSYLLLGPNLAHAGRLLMVIGTFIIVLYQLRGRFRYSPHKSTVYSWSLLLLAGNYTLFDGLYWSALSELTGVFLVSLGLWTKNSYLKGSLFLLAALGKEPFIWLVLAFSVYEWLSGRRRSGFLFVSLGILLSAVIYVQARQGSYTSGTSTDFVSTILSGAPKVAVAIAPWALVLVIGTIVLRPKWKPTGLSTVFFVAGTGYLFTVWLWGPQGYLMGPVAFLCTVALTQGLVDIKPLFTSRIFVGSFTGISVVLAFLIVGWSGMKAIERNDFVVGTREWTLANGSGKVIAVNQIEATVRIAQINEIVWPGWTGTLIDYGKQPSDFVIVLTDFGEPAFEQSCEPVESWKRGYIRPTLCNSSIN